MHGLLRSPLFLLVYLCVNVGPRDLLPAPLPAPFSATESGPLGLTVCECGAAGSASGQTACPFRPTLCQSWSCHGNTSPLRPGCLSPPLLPVWMNVSFLSPRCRTSSMFDFLSVLVVRGGTVCLPTPPSWFSLCCLLPLHGRKVSQRSFRDHGTTRVDEMVEAETTWLKVFVFIFK